MVIVPNRTLVISKERVLTQEQQTLAKSILDVIGIHRIPSFLRELSYRNDIPHSDMPRQYIENVVLTACASSASTRIDEIVSVVRWTSENHIYFENVVDAAQELKSKLN
jgi:hypothetical protein